MAYEVMTNPRNTRHGLGLANAALPPGCGWLSRKLVRFQRALASACMDAHGGRVTLSHCLAIDAACAWERHRQLCLRWLRKTEDELSAETRLAFSLSAAKAADARNRACEKLDLDASGLESLKDILYRREPDAPEGLVCDVEPAKPADSDLTEAGPTCQTADDEGDAVAGDSLP